MFGNMAIFTAQQTCLLAVTCQRGRTHPTPSPRRAPTVNPLRSWRNAGAVGAARGMPHEGGSDREHLDALLIDDLQQLRGGAARMLA